MKEDFTFTINHALIAVFVLGITTGFAGGAVANGSILNLDQPTENQQNNPSEDNGEEELETVENWEEKVTLENRTSLGNPDAEVTIVEFTDYQCPFCRRHTLSAFPQIHDEYIESGDVHYVVKEFPVEELGHDKATELSKAAICADEQGKFEEAHMTIFEKQQEINARGTARFESSDIQDWMTEVGLDMDEYSQCMEREDFNIDQDKREGQEVGVRGTPTFLINGVKVVGAQPYAQFESIIESELE